MTTPYVHTPAPTFGPVFSTRLARLVSRRSMTPRILFHFLALSHSHRDLASTHHSHLPSSVIRPSFSFLAFYLSLNNSSFPPRTVGRSLRTVRVFLFRTYLHGCRVLSCHHSIFLVALHWEDSFQPLLPSACFASGQVYKIPFLFIPDAMSYDLDPYCPPGIFFF